ncbi:unnamed protein product [Polarella glacialis]|uniref:Peptidase A1 domain-containing protein n=1 Tax=Polarella glacialis TaxID=89957 RepID=A0A813LX94_POLGL|nr:unnamed protein product [Polarella glacialis]CAE8589252.1 unnamed protein product [Polarella glacialis]CAE8649490.1 unnamed protein product [Polarella glacialis]CAE8742141.1 unnamed protein product [Polarella glacialis]
MPSRHSWVPVLLALAAGSATSPGAPASEVEQPRRLVIDLKLLPVRRKITGSKAAAKSQLSSAGAEEAPLRQLRTPINSHSTTLGNYDNVQYHMEIEVGEPCPGRPRQLFQVVPDTGSSDLWIPASNCTRCKDGSRKFDIASSCSCKQIGDRVTFRYGDGTVAVGGSFLDTVRVGDLKVTKQLLIQVDSMESETHMKSDGILGLAHHYESDKRTRGRTFMSTLFTENPTLPRQFSFHLTGNTDRQSQLVFGDADLEHHAKESEFKYGKGYYMKSTDLWLTSVWSIGWSGTGVEVAFPDSGTLGSPALIDSGSSLLVLAPDIYDRLLEELKWRFTGCKDMPEQQIISCQCPPANDLSRIPTLVINMIDEQDKQFSLCMSPDEYILESIDPIDGSTTCVPSIQRGSADQPVPMIFGMTFMRSFYVNFDLENSRIGFARSSLSPLPGNAKCSVDAQPLLRRSVWFLSVLVAFMSVFFACYVLFAPGGCSRDVQVRRDSGQPISAQMPQVGQATQVNTSEEGL